MDVHGAKGSVKNRVYQFLLIRLWKDRRKKRKQQALLKKKNLEEMRKKVIEEVVGRRNTQIWKLSKPPQVFNKKEGVIVTLFPLGKKPDKVIEVVEEKPKVGIGKDTELEKKLKTLEKETTKVVSQVDVEVKKKELEPEKLETKREKLEQDLYKIEILQKEYQQVKKGNPNLSHIALTKNENIKKMAVNVQTLEQAEMVCKEELARVEMALKSVEQIEKKDSKQEEKPSFKEETKKNNLEKPLETVKIEKSTIQQKPVDSNVKRGIIMGGIAGGTLIVFPALLQRSIEQKHKKEENNISKSNVGTESNKEFAHKKAIGNQNERLNIKKETNEAKEKNSKLKLYRSKLEASKDAEILIKAELERQKNYLRRMNEKIDQVDISRRIEYRFRGLHHLLGQVLTFTLGIFTIPFSRHRIFGTALGLTLIGNSIRGMRNSLKVSKEQTVYIEWKDFTKQIYNERLALKQLDTMVVTSLKEIKELKKDVETEFYGKVSFEEYEKMKSKLEVMELKLLEKQKQIIEVEEQLQKTEEKNKVKIKEMKEIRRQSS